jgi:hypothetical protein
MLPVDHLLILGNAACFLPAQLRRFHDGIEVRLYTNAISPDERGWGVCSPSNPF